MSRCFRKVSIIKSKNFYFKEIVFLNPFHKLIQDYYRENSIRLKVEKTNEVSLKWCSFQGGKFRCIIQGMTQKVKEAKDQLDELFKVFYLFNCFRKDEELRKS